ncbi:hypothetical protein G7Y89_g7531 [Cudoniella acicularis]|uniref:Uncharacterized protein n=1 Tax=Cudoniella acicularis TaxID=354080 RepID=A0A8H4RKR2_9HELO|nr:hypothetical protein G7Y89_g7531 [Cudoniella acicularis]
MVGFLVLAVIGIRVEKRFESVWGKKVEALPAIEVQYIGAWDLDQLAFGEWRLYEKSASDWTRHRQPMALQVDCGHRESLDRPQEEGCDGEDVSVYLEKLGSISPTDKGVVQVDARQHFEITLGTTLTGRLFRLC